MIEYRRATSQNNDFQVLVRLLDKHLSVINGNDDAFFAALNTVEQIHHVIVAYSGNSSVGCGALKGFADDTAEIKRMFVLEEYRGRGIAQEILAELEVWALEIGFSRCILETSKQLTSAVRLYEKGGYILIPNYGQYQGVETSVCMQKIIHLV
jgi:putative acetyltransferase